MHPIDHVTLTPVVSPSAAAAAAADAAASSGPITIVPEAHWRGTELRIHWTFFSSGCISQGAGGKRGVAYPRGLSRAVQRGMTCKSPKSTLRSVPSIDTRYVYLASAEPTNITMIGSWDEVKA